MWGQALRHSRACSRQCVYRHLFPKWSRLGSLTYILGQFGERLTPRRVAEIAPSHCLPEAKASCQLTLAHWTGVRARGRPNVRLGSKPVRLRKSISFSEYPG